MPILLAMVVFGVSGCADPVPAGDRQIVVNELSDRVGRVSECLRFTLDPDSDDLTVEHGEEVVAITATSIYVRLGEPGAVVWAEVDYDLLTSEWQFVSDHRAAVGEEIFGQTGRDIKKATSAELAWLQLGCNVDPQASTLVQVTGQSIGVYDINPPGARGFQVVPDGGRWAAPKPSVAIEDLDSAQVGALWVVAESLRLLQDESRHVQK